MNARMAGWTMVVISLGFAATALASSVKYDYDHGIDFSKWTKAAWRSRDANADMVEKRIAAAVELGFAGRGYVLVEPAANADFLIEYRAVAWEEREIEDTWHGPAFGRSLRVSRERKGALAIRVYDRSTGMLAWRGVVSDALADSPEQADKKTAKAVERLL